MEINATYAYTTQRNRYDGKTHFRVVPQTPPTEHGNTLLECIGIIPPYLPGMPIVLTGHIEQSCFMVETAQLDCQTRKGIGRLLTYLSTQHLNGELTQNQIEEIVEVCQDDIMTFCSIDDCLPILYDICRQSKNHKSMVRHLVSMIQNMEHNHNFYTVLLRYGIPCGQIDAMLQDGLSLDRLHDSPYLVISNYDVPFSAVDSFARHECGMTDYAKPRCLGYVYAAIRYLLSIGHTCCTLPQLVETVNNRYARFLTGISFGPALINACLPDLNTICRYHTIDGTTYIFPNSTWNAEAAAVHHIHRLQHANKAYNDSITVDDTATEIGINYNINQRTAFEFLHTSGVKILTGPSGSGKTAVIKGLIRNFEANGNGIVHLSAATGNAAKATESAVNRETETVHTMLRMTTINGMICGRGLNDPVDADLIIVDEISMMGIQLFSLLVGAVKSGAILLLIGDEHQLQSMECGNVLHDLIASGEIPVCRLTEILQPSSTIDTNASKVNAGNAQLDQDDTFAIKAVSDHSIQQILTGDYNPLTSQIITPFKHGPMGTLALNDMIQEHFNCSSPVVASYGNSVFRLGDKVIMTSNNYESGYVNGDMGYIRKQCKNGDLQIAFAKGCLCISQNDLCNMDLAYAITIAQSHGSEFPRVHIVLPEGGRNKVTRCLLYTAITRAQEQVIIYNEHSALQDAIAECSEKARTTMLSQRLKVKKERW